jgi:hypothetical protein
MSDEQIASQSEDVQEDAVQGALAMFDLLPEQVEEQEIETEEEPPAIEEPANVRKVKFNKEEREVKEEEIDSLLQQGLALPKERERKEQYESALKRAAKLAGYDDVNQYLTNLDTIEQQAIEHKSNEIDALKQQMLQEYADAGFDPATLENFIDNHPLFVNAKATAEREQQALAAQKTQQAEEAKLQGWKDLFAKYPTLAETMSEDGKAEWFTPELEAKVARGYDPIDAYELVNRNTITAEERRLAEQNVLKQQRLNKRAAIGTDTAPADNEPAVPKEISDAFALFGLDPKAAKKYITK